MSKENFAVFKKDNNDFANKVNKLNMLRNLSKLNKEKNDGIVVGNDNLQKDEIYKRGIGNVLKLSNFLKNKKENAIANPLPPRRMSPTSMVKESIKNYIRNNNAMGIPQPELYEEEAILEVNNTENLMKEYADKLKEQNATKQNFYKNYAQAEENKKISEIEEYIEPQIGEGNISEIKNNSNRHVIDVGDKDILSDSFETEKPKIKPIVNRPNSGIKANKEVIQVVDKKAQNEVESKKAASEAAKQDCVIKLTNDKRQDMGSNTHNGGNGPLKPNVDLLSIKKDLQVMLFNTMNTIDTFETRVTKKLDYLDKRINNSSKTIAKAVEVQRATHKDTIKAVEVEIKRTTEERFYKDTVEKLKKEMELSAKKESNNEPPIIRTWKHVLKDIENSNLNTAYTRILETGDDVYLLRLLFITGPVIQQLNPEIAKNVILRINLVSRSHRVQSLNYSLIENAYYSELFPKLNKDDKNELLETLYEYSGLNSDIGTKSAELYAKITSDELTDR
jgi:hypothetical protein